MSNTWRDFCKQNDIPINDQYFLIYCKTRENMEEYVQKLRKDYGLKKIDANPGSIPRGPWIYANLNTKLMFHGNIGVDVLGGPVVGGHALTMDEFTCIADEFKKYEGLKLLEFNNEEQKRKSNVCEDIENEEWCKECKEFLEKNEDAILVQIGPKPMYDLLDGKRLTIRDVDRLLRMNRYRGRTIIDGECDIHYFLISLATMEMISVLNHVDYFIENSIWKRAVDFEVFLQLHIRFKGRIRNQITVGDCTSTFDIIGNY